MEHFFGLIWVTCIVFSSDMCYRRRCLQLFVLAVNIMLDWYEWLVSYFRVKFVIAKKSFAVLVLAQDILLDWYQLLVMHFTEQFVTAKKSFSVLVLAVDILLDWYEWLVSYFLKKMGHCRPLFLYFRLFHTVHSR